MSEYYDSKKDKIKIKYVSNVALLFYIYMGWDMSRIT